jgi:hypothetical protein
MHSHKRHNTGENNEEGVEWGREKGMMDLVCCLFESSE